MKLHTSLPRPGRPVLVALLALTSPLASANEPGGPRVDFVRDVRPILSEKCFACHGPDQEHREANLRLDTKIGVFEHPGKRKIVSPGKPEESQLWLRITHEDNDLRMPPAETGKSLNDQQRDVLRRWIASGAEWREHWSLAPLVRPAVPSIPADKSPANPVDSFLIAGLQAEGLALSPSADASTLARRFAFDLTGLPPEAADLSEFLSAYGENSDLAVAAFTERLLASPHFGERMAMPWLDLVRFADTVGYHGDQEHHISPYRDYVIQAFNANMPFDQFTLEQLAGDLLPNPTINQKIASGYNRLLQTSHEGGVQQREYLAKYSADRVRNLGAVWLGATLGCAECHDHKYDPFPQRDFYRLAAFFADIDDYQSFKGVDGNPTKREPEMDVIPAPLRERLEQVEADLKSLAGRTDPESAARIAQLNQQRELLSKQKRRTMITVSIAPRPIRVLARGDWLDDSGEVVAAGVPAIFRQIEQEGSVGRLDLARWLTSNDHPLTSRVFVNRLWKVFFGKGLAPSLEDLGSQGEPPQYPELLDWLAREFVESGWNVKHVVRLIVTSHAYRQSSLDMLATPAADEAPPQTTSLRSRDPANRLFARQGRPRLDAEMIRDNALAVSGLLVRHVGGRSARPYQPEGYYRHLNFPKRNYGADTGADQYRRGVYTHWQRCYLHPMLKAFDAPSREECTAERAASNTPQASLVLLNDPTFLEAARVFAARILREGGATREARFRWAWRTALSREPQERELTALNKLLDQDLAEFRSNPPSVDQFLGTGEMPIPSDLERTELAGWTSIARTIFNLNEFTTRN